MFGDLSGNVSGVFFCPAVFSSLRTASLRTVNNPTQQDGIIDFDYVGKAPFSARKS